MRLPSSTSLEVGSSLLVVFAFRDIEKVARLQSYLSDAQQIYPSLRLILMMAPIASTAFINIELDGL